MTIHERLSSLGLRFPSVLIPADTVDLQRWAVIACDQFTSDPAYWKSVEEYVGEAPSTLHIIHPEIYLTREDPARAAARIQRAMNQLRENGSLREVPSSAVLAERRLPSGTVRHGLVLAVDLDAYDYRPETAALIRASEETIPDRLPPRAEIRRGATLETPHVLVLYNDPGDSLLAPLKGAKSSLEKLYETPLMMEGGSIAGYRIPLEDSLAEAILQPLEALREGNLLFATGDGNHSLAAAKEVWTSRKAAGAAPDDPFRYCLVELVNVYDPGLPFHPIHRIGLAGKSALVATLEKITGGTARTFTRQAFLEAFLHRGVPEASVGILDREGGVLLEIPAGGPLAVAAADQALAETGARGIDYVHGNAEACEAADRAGGLALLLPEFPRDQLFPTVAARGTLPRKAFSLGEARDKRYYLECRSLTSKED
ncbi:hypothetical protein AU468_07560 [Alkalispirochaeta sphaeroplastigenens]|uniref:DUF1015 domain-containing protein n=1 Tax=Alkalispirochaeta sphaeroplastigenens TaxID=1187066 RepID=A0A2S4JQQ3_9SPIO|nr:MULTISPECIES: DUF1015 domain-containing protein [Alkalispirochaeta]POR01803.1 hypothetical protein AU468_07560 [Alkalispirochaeta sphaeroplastigenens]